MFLHYGFDPASAVVWLEVPSAGGESGLCEQHAERLTPPRGWTIDDRRDPTLRLFRPGPEDVSQVRRQRRRRSSRAAKQQQNFPLFDDVSVEIDAECSDFAFDRSRSEVEKSEDLGDQGLSPLLSRAFRGTRLAED